LKHSLPRPTDAELAILRVLWERGPSTVRQVHEILGQRQSIGYTTALKLLQIMTEKGLVIRNETQRAHLYRPRLSPDETQGQLVSDLMERAFGGSAAKLVQRALSSKPASPEDLAEVQKLLDDLAGEKS
jgi:BlaI family transcriptional regulator, penicillinase repressor